MSETELAKMVRTFRVMELQSLLTYAGLNKSGKKYILQMKVLELLNSKSLAIDMKIRELFIKLNQSRAYSRGREMYRKSLNKEHFFRRGEGKETGDDSLQDYRA
ncbi:hypothetical protein TNCV_4162781 [Trichonephila clavipes]|nr:hypothetical protein TNCV_4162781 [Trichonephila clavipes]